jgi:hypothetical protein
LSTTLILQEMDTVSVITTTLPATAAVSAAGIDEAKSGIEVSAHPRVPHSSSSLPPVPRIGDRVVVEYAFTNPSNVMEQRDDVHRLIVDKYGMDKIAAKKKKENCIRAFSLTCEFKLTQLQQCFSASTPLSASMPLTPTPTLTMPPPSASVAVIDPEDIDVMAYDYTGMIEIVVPPTSVAITADPIPQFEPHSPFEWTDVDIRGAQRVAEQWITKPLHVRRTAKWGIWEIISERVAPPISMSATILAAPATPAAPAIPAQPLVLAGTEHWTVDVSIVEFNRALPRFHLSHQVL